MAATDCTFMSVLKANPYHAADGSFTSKDKAAQSEVDRVKAGLSWAKDRKIMTAADVAKIPEDQRSWAESVIGNYEKETGLQILLVERGEEQRLYAVDTPELKKRVDLLPPGLGVVTDNKGTSSLKGLNNDRVMNPRNSMVMTLADAQKWRVAKEVADELGYDADKIHVSTYEKTFKVGESTFKEGGHYDPFTGRVTLNTGGMQGPDAGRGITAHEISHDAFQKVYKDAGKFLSGKTPRVAGRQVDDFIDWKNKNAGELERTDGVTEYSKAYWGAYLQTKNSPFVGPEERKKAFDTAVNETLAEISALRVRGEHVTFFREGEKLVAVPKVAEVWRDLHASLMEAYKAIQGTAHV